MDSRELGVAMMRLGAESLRSLILGDPILTPRHGFAVARRAGLLCYSSTKLDAEVFNHVSGYGTFAPATQRGIDALLRHYARLRDPVRVEVLVPTVTRRDRALLVRNGFRDNGAIFQCHVRTTTRPPRTRPVAGLAVARVTPAEAVTYAKLATRGFGDGHNEIGNVFERGWIRQIRVSPRVHAFMGSVNGTPASTGVLYRGRSIAGLYSGSVLRRFRGRGIQNAMIAARLAYGWSRGIRSFYSWSDPENTASAQNLRDEGFRTRYQVHMYVHDAG